MNVASHRFYDLDFEPEARLLRFLWKKDTAAMTDEDFRNGLRHFALVAFKNGASRLLVDLRSFRYRPGEDTMSWRGQEISPLYHLIGVERFAYILPEDAPAPPADAPEKNPGENFATRYFAKPEEATAWVSN
jgi:hypothetical protein